MQKIFISQLIIIFTFTVSFGNWCKAAILFQDDDFGTIESTSLILSSNDAGANDSSVQFGNDSTASENGTILWNVSSNRFSIDHAVDVDGNFTATGNISTSGSGAITSASTLTASNGLTQTTGTLNLTATSGAFNLSGLSTSSINAGSNGINFTSGNFNTTATGINSTAIGATTPSTGAFTSLSASSLSLTTPLSLSYGGTNNNLTADNGAVVYSDASKLSLLSSTATAGKILQSGASSAPSWSTPTYPSGSGSSGKIIRSDGTNNVYSSASYPDSGSTAGDIIRFDGTNFVSTSVNSSQATPSNPTATTSTTGVMMGLNGSITPNRSGKILIIVSGDLSNSTSGDGSKVQIRYGTGSAPSNGAALTGTATGASPQMTCAGILSGLVSLSGCTSPFSTNSVVTGLTVGTTYWIDLSLAAVTGGTATLKDVSVSVIEL